MTQQLLHNPLAWKLALLTLGSVVIFVIAIVAIRRIRRGIQSEPGPLSFAGGKAGLPLATYDGLARQIREQQQELQQAREQYEKQAGFSSTISESVLANLNCGVLFFDHMGMVRQANRAAKSLLGYASPFSFHMRDLFRGITRIQWPETGEQAQSPAPLLQAMQEALNHGKSFGRSIVDYRTPGGRKRVLGLSGSVVKNKKGEVTGLSCVIDDLTQVTELEQRVERSENLASLGEISAGLAHEFKDSMATVLGHAQALLREDSDASTRFYAEKIIAELDSLSRIINEFLEFAASTKN